jgi:SAM-dependent methyltransferase
MPRHRIDARQLIEHHLEAGRPTGWFEPLYARVGRNVARLPWHAGGAHPYLVDWLDDPVADVPGRRAIVVGCGLGDDAVEVARRGYEVTAIDIAPTALRRARRRARRAGVTPVTWREADVLSTPDDLVGAFDLVVEVHTVPWLPGVVRDAAMQAIGALAAPGGVVVAVTLLAVHTDAVAAAEGPPWPQAPSELAAYRAAGLERVALEHPDPDETGRLEARLTFRRGA